MWFLLNQTCNAYPGPLFWRCERPVFMWSAETLDCNAWASNISPLSLFIYTSITEQPGPSSLHGGKAAQAFMAEHICGVLWGNRGRNTWAKWACLELWIPVVFNWMMRTSRSWSFPTWNRSQELLYHKAPEVTRRIEGEGEIPLDRKQTHGWRKKKCWSECGERGENK